MKIKIKALKAREILDSRGEPTIEAEMFFNNKKVFASVPSGKSKGKYEAVELRDNDKKRYFGKGVQKAVKNINQIIAPKLRRKAIKNQKEIDDYLINLDGTKDKSKLGVNAILAVSMLYARAGAETNKLPLYKYIGRIYSSNASTSKKGLKMPLSCFNLINGGAHAGNDLSIQEFMVVPQTNKLRESLRMAAEIYQNLKKILAQSFGESAVNLGDEGGFAPSLKITREALNFLIKAINSLSYEKKVKIGLDCASSEFYNKRTYFIDGKALKAEELSQFYLGLINKYPILFLEDPFAEDDWKGWNTLNSQILNPKSQLLVVGDDLTATNPQRIEMAKNNSACNGIILKINQIGTITESLESAKLAKSFAWKIIVSHRSGETNDDFIADLAVGIGADFIKTGAPARGERVAKYNRLLKIEEEYENFNGYF